jgi:hypothetical protein
MWCVAEIDAEYIARTEDVLALYEKPYNPHEPVVCLDEKPVVLRAEVRHPQPARPGSIAKRDGEYKRRGTANVFCVVEAKAGRPFTRPTTNRSGAVFAKTIEQLARRYPHARTSHLVFDNLNTPAANRWRNTSVYRKQSRSGAALPSTELPSTAAGSIKPRWKSVCSPANALVHAESKT